jgi:hypothetical protein
VGVKMIRRHVLDKSRWKLDFTRNTQDLGVSRYDPFHPILLVRRNEEDDFDIPISRFKSPVREHPWVRGEDLDKTSARWVVVVVQRATLVSKMRRKVIKLVRRVDEDGPVVDESERLAFLLPRDFALNVQNRCGVLTDNVDVLKGKKRFADVFGECEDIVFQIVGVWDALGETAHETVARRVFVHDSHSSLLKRVSALEKSETRWVH